MTDVRTKGLLDNLPKPGGQQPSEHADVDSVDMRSEFARLGEKKAADTGAERAFLQSKIELIRSDLNLNEDEKALCIGDLQRRVDALIVSDELS